MTGSKLHRLSGVALRCIALGFISFMGVPAAFVAWALLVNVVLSQDSFGQFGWSAAP